LSCDARADQLRAMAEAPLDVLVIGGGITGVGCALDAASRGLRTAIVEADDWASGTSSRSSKMIHGGLRYLATGDVGVVRESLRERRALQRNAAHLVRPLSMLLPAYGRGPMPFDRMKIGAGLWLYEALGHRAAAGALHKWLSRDELQALVPNIAIDSAAAGGRLRGAHHYHDACADDCRLVLSVLRSAVSHGALAVNGTRVTSLLRDGDRIVGAKVAGDLTDGRELELAARVVINAAGVWADRIADAAHDSPLTVTPSKGVHVVVPRERAGIASGIAFFEQMGNANVFLEPWADDLAIIGTTDAPYDGDLTDPEATEAEINWLLDTANEFLHEPIARNDVLATYAGLRPLIAAADTRTHHTKDVSRRHLLRSDPGVVTIAGGKLTAYRSMAEDAIDAATRQLGRAERCVTATLALDGCRPAPTTSEVETVARRLGGISALDAAHLVRRHGTNVDAIITLVERDAALAERIHPERPYIQAEAVWAYEQEQARGADDIIHRRTRIGIETADPSAATHAALAVQAS
jgi:glycerol-3-phosphate dehydrogenase